MLVNQLPPESATATALRLDESDLVPDGPEPERDPESEQWSRTEHLLASIRDEIHTVHYLYASVHSGKQRLKWKPEPLPRPGVKPSKPKRRVSAEQTDVLAAHLARTQPPIE